MTVCINYLDSRWDELNRWGVAGRTADGTEWEACVVCGKRVFKNKPYWPVEIAWHNGEAMTADDDPKYSQGSFPIGDACLRKNYQLRPHVERISP